MKKILTAIPGNSSFLEPTMGAFLQMGWEIKNVNYRSLSFTAGAANFFNLQKDLFKDLASKKMPGLKRIINNNEIIRVAKEWKPDMFLTFKGEIILPETILKLKSLGIKTVNWYPDYLPDSEKNYDFLKVYDCFIYWDGPLTKKYNKEGFKNVLYLPFAAVAYDNPAPKNKKYQINFVGRWQPNKEPRIFPVSNLGLKVWGDNKWAESKLASCYQGGPTTAEEMMKIIRLSKITLNIHVVDQVYSEGTNVRTFETTAAGGFLLVNKRKCLYQLFDVGREIEVFDSDEELVEKAKFYLKNDSAREKVALAGWRRASKDHTYLKRFQVLLKYLNI